MSSTRSAPKTKFVVGSVRRMPDKRGLDYKSYDFIAVIVRFDYNKSTITILRSIYVTNYRNRIKNKS